MRQTWWPWRRQSGVLRCLVSFGEHQNWFQLVTESRSYKSCLALLTILCQWILSLKSISQWSHAVSMSRAVTLSRSTKYRTKYSSDSSVAILAFGLSFPLYLFRVTVIRCLFFSLD